jgi:hypothetical protein
MRVDIFGQSKLQRLIFPDWMKSEIMNTSLLLAGSLLSNSLVRNFVELLAVAIGQQTKDN